MIIEAYGKQFEMLNDDKVLRVTEGTIGRLGQPTGGIGKDAAPEAILAGYDRLGGAIRLNGDRVKRGCFFDFGKKADIAKPEVILQFIINGKTVDVPADEPMPAEVRAAKAAEQGDIAEVDEDVEEKPKRKGGNLIGKGKKAKDEDAG